jgi:hypothetical protein
MSSTNTREIDDNVIVDLYNSLKHFEFGSSSYDAFARLRVSTPTTIFESKQIVSEQDLLWDRAQVSGAGTSFLYSRPRASSTLSVSANIAGKYVRRTRRYFNYQPGKGQFVLMSAILGCRCQGVWRRIGYFDDANGIYFGVNHESLFCAVRSSVTGVPVDTIYHQSQWNLDKLDGTGPSGIVLDTALPQIYWFDFEWLGVGRVRYGVFIRGMPIPMHQVSFANSPGASSVYMSTPSLPMSVEIESDGTNTEAASLEHICSSVLSEGGERLPGVARSVSRGITVRQVSTPNLVPIISLRARDGFQFTTINILSVEVLCLNNQSTRWALILNPTFAGVDGAVWVPVPSSTAEYDISRTQALTVTGGTVIDEGYISAQLRSGQIKPTSYLGLGRRLLSSSPRDQFILAVQPLAGNNVEYVGSIQYEEST